VKERKRGGTSDVSTPVFRPLSVRQSVTTNVAMFSESVVARRELSPSNLLIFIVN